MIYREFLKCTEPKRVKFASELGGALFSFRFLLFILLIAALVPVAFAGWSSLYSEFLERSAPFIKITEMPRGIGHAPVAIRLELSDYESGLDEVVVRTRQRGSVNTILKQSLGGRRQAEITIDFPGEKSALEEGKAELEVRAFDRSFWSNVNDRTIPLKIDFRKPRVEVLSSQHNAREGGSQLVFYRAFDEDLAISGVKVGGQSFIGFPARGIDKELSDKNLFVAIYALDVTSQASSKAVKVFAEDQVGNSTSESFYNKVNNSNLGRNTNYNLSSEFLRSRASEIADANFKLLQQYEEEFGRSLEYKSSKGSGERLLEKFKLVNENLRDFNETKILNKLQGPRYERYWDDAFEQPAGTIRSTFGAKLNYLFDRALVSSRLSKGYEISPVRGESNVYAANAGIVLFSANLAVYGRTLAIDHGLGLVSIYGYLDSINVAPGQAVDAGEVIATLGSSGLTPRKQLYFELRVHGIPVNPREWWDENWYHAHVVAKINNVKRQLGIPVYRAFN